MKATEKRTQVYLTAAQHRAAMALARRRGGSLAGVVRDALDHYLDHTMRDADVTWDGDPAFTLIGALELPARTSHAALAEDIDQAVYEEDAGSWSSPTALGSSPPSTPRTRPTRRPPKRGAASRKRASASSPRSSS
jgi:hypothetical protein